MKTATFSHVYWKPNTKKEDDEGFSRQAGPSALKISFFPGSVIAVEDYMFERAVNEDHMGCKITLSNGEKVILYETREEVIEGLEA